VFFTKRGLNDTKQFFKEKQNNALCYKCIVSSVFSSHFDGLETSFSALFHFTLFEIHSSSVCQESHVFRVEFERFLVMLERCREVLFLVSSISKFLFFKSLRKNEKKFAKLSMHDFTSSTTTLLCRL